MTRILFGTLLGMLMLLTPVRAQETRTITDHSGAQVAVPADPQRIVSLHDWSITVILHELDANIIASTGRLKTDGSYYIRSGEELYGLTFDDIEMASVHGMIDLERISELEPDLIIGNLGDTLKVRDQLAKIAPTLLFDPMNGKKAFENYATLADWANRTDRFSSLKAQYDEKIAVLRKDLKIPDNAPTYLAMMPNIETGELRILRTYGAQTAVLDDLGFKQAAITAQVPADRQEANFSAEIIGQLDADYIFTTHNPARGDDQAAVMAELDQIAPGYRQLLPAVRNDHFISMSRFHVYPPTFAAADYVMDRVRDALR